MEIEKLNVPDSIFSGILGQLDSFLGGQREESMARAKRAESHLNLVQQLHDLYDEIEAAGGRRPRDLAQENVALREQLEGAEAGIGAGLVPQARVDASMYEQLGALYAEIEEAGGRRPRELSEMCDQLVQQLEAIYREIEDAGGSGPAEQKVIIDSLVEQLNALYAEKAEATEGSKGSMAVEVFSSLVGQLNDLYHEKEGDLRDEMLDNLSAQLSDLYMDREQGDEAFGIIESMAAQLHDLYSDRELQPYSEEVVESLVLQLEDLYADRDQGGDLQAMVTSLDAQVCAFAEEKAELEGRVERLSRQLESVRQRARRMTAALAETALSE